MFGTVIMVQKRIPAADARNNRKSAAREIMGKPGAYGVILNKSKL